ncbi:MAG: DnaJ domain-containing protein [Agathobacter sp.]|uniref:DnaJ domain-containing protein n=1 Tax=Agathobacter sp. TaxID=2021311 RepID=UPI0025874589|nr:DnaJ domain-containing protein [Agathobacter sp.]MCR5678522.1 DnaJ domain-containing protein [Agathobacter sp.]
MIRSKAEACRILGVGILATKDEIKSAYKNMAKRFHPDAPGGSKEQYYIAREAYEFLMNGMQIDAGRILGTTPDMKRRREEEDAYARWFEKQRVEHLQQQMQKEQEEEMLRKKQKEEYDKAMEAINAIRVAEAIKALIREDKK